MSTAFQTVHVRVNDAATGKPTPVRIRFVGADGQYYAPFGRLADFRTWPAEDVGGNLLLGDKKYAYIDGTCEIRLPVGMVEVEIHKGLEFLPVHEKVELKQGKLSLRLEIRRWIDPRAQGWHSGDTHCFYLCPHAALLEGAAEDLAVVNLLAYTSWIATNPHEYEIQEPDKFIHYPAISNILAFSGQQPALEMPQHMVVVNTCNQGDFLGRLALLNCHRVVYPLWFRPSVESWTLADLCGQCHRKGGLTVALDYFATQLNHELLADAAQGLIDTIATASNVFENLVLLENWFDLIEAGINIPLAAGSGKRSNSEVLGMPRTYAQLRPDEEFTYKNWIEAVRSGRTFVTAGPMLFFEVNGQGPGSRLELPANTMARIKATAQGMNSFDRVECFFNRKLIGTAPAQKAGQTWEARLEIDFPIEEPGWFYACCRGASAITSPIYLSLPGQPLKPKSEAIQKLLERLEKQSAWVSQSEHFENDQQRQRMANVYLEAKKRLEEKLSSQ